MSEVTSQAGATGGFDLTQFYGVFFEEAGENLSSMEAMLLEIDADSPSDEELNAIFRVAHSIKGGAATFGFSDVTELTHELETLLDRLRRNELRLRRDMVDVLLEAGDVLKSMLARYQAKDSGASAAPDTRDLVARIRQLATGKPASTLDDGRRRLRVRVGPLADGALADNLAELFRDIASLGIFEAIDGGRLSSDRFREFKVTTASADAELIELFSFHVSREQIQIVDLAGTWRADAGDTSAGAPAKTGDDADPGYGFFVDPQSLPAARKGAQTESKPKAGKAAPAANLESTSLRVSVEKVDQLINLVGELVITQSMLTQQAKILDPVTYQTLLSGVVDLERNTRHMQESVMSIRMIPMSFVFSRFPRMLRDLADKLGKSIELKTVGEATELDKGLIEKIIDPLTHLVRNSADHGIESTDRRVAAGKPAHGTITLSAAHQGGSILIEVMDDGAGLNRERILAKAKERGLPGVHDGLSDPEVCALIWEPGFSTADQVSDVSGRGVGMDVVRRNIAALNGSVELDSAEGYGTRVSVRLPLTLAIMDGMSIGVGDEIYILPLGSVVESFQVEAGRIQTLGGTARVVKVRDSYLPVAALEDVFQVPRLRDEQDDLARCQIMVIVEAEGARIALLVDELLGQHQVVVKNLEANYRRVPGVSGATILGDGRVALIIDTGGLVKRARH